LVEFVREVVAVPSEVTLGEVARRVSDLAETVANHGRRISELEVKEGKRDSTVEMISEDVKEIKSGISRLSWLVIAAVVAAFVGFVIRGGLS
jgi:hypothetical protein